MYEIPARSRTTTFSAKDGRHNHPLELGKGRKVFQSGTCFNSPGENGIDIVMLTRYTNVTFMHDLLQVSCLHLPSSQLHSQRLVHPKRLSYAQVQHNLLAAARNCVGPHIPVQALNLLCIKLVDAHQYLMQREKTYLPTLAAATITQSAKNLARFPGTKLKRDSGLRFQAGDSATKFEHCFRFVHDITLVNNILKPVVGSLNLPGHVRKFQPDHWVVNEPFTKSTSLVSIFYRFLIADSGEANTLNDYSDTLMVEVGHNH